MAHVLGAGGALSRRALIRRARDLRFPQTHLRFTLLQLCSHMPALVAMPYLLSNHHEYCLGQLNYCHYASKEDSSPSPPKGNLATLGRYSCQIQDSLAVP
jgi:hypothetical protein